MEYRGFESNGRLPFTPLHYTSVTWVVPPKTALGVALMDESGGRYNGNEIEEEALHYYHGAMLLGTKILYPYFTPSTRWLQKE